MTLSDAEIVREQYANESNLRARQALYEEVEGPDARDVAWDAIVAANQRTCWRSAAAPVSCRSAWRASSARR